MKYYTVIINKQIHTGTAKEITIILKTKSCRVEWTLWTYMRNVASRNIKWNGQIIRRNSYDNFIQDMAENEHIKILLTEEHGGEMKSH